MSFVIQGLNDEFTTTTTANKKLVGWMFTIDSACNFLQAPLRHQVGRGRYSHPSLHCVLQKVFFSCRDSPPVKHYPGQKKEPSPRFAARRTLFDLDIMLDDARSAQGKVIRDCPQLSPCADRAWYHTMEQRSSHRESRRWFFFVVQGSIRPFNQSKNCMNHKSPMAVTLQRLRNLFGFYQMFWMCVCTTKMRETISDETNYTCQEPSGGFMKRSCILSSTWFENCALTKRCDSDDIAI